MSHHQCYYSLQNALYRVFIRPTIAKQKPPSILCRTFISSPQTCQKLTRKQREERGTTPEDEERIRKAREKIERKAAQKAEPLRRTRLPLANKQDFGPKEKEKLPENDEITAPVIDLVDLEGRRHLSVKTVDILWNLDRETEVLVTLKAAGPENKPLCRIYSLKEILQRERKRKEHSESRDKGLRDAERREKEVEMTWLIGPGDLTLKLAQICRFLTEGRKVTVTVNRKFKRRVPDLEFEEMEELIQKIRDAALEVGAKETRRADGRIGESLMMVFEGKLGNVVEKTAKQAAETRIAE